MKIDIKYTVYQILKDNKLKRSNWGKYNYFVR